MRTYAYHTFFCRLEEEFFSLFEAEKQRVLSSESHTLDSGLAVLDSVSDIITEKVSTSRVLAGINGSLVARSIDAWRQDDQHNVHSCKLQAGCLDALARANTTGWGLGVLSINWCPDLIHAMLLRDMQHKPDDFPCWSNRVDKEGRIELAVSGASAKKERIIKLQEKAGCGVVYVGDSVTDLPALLAADLGVLIGSSNTVREFTAKYNVKVESLSSLHALTSIFSKGPKAPNTVWAAESWADIDRMVIQHPGILGTQL
jgi:hypothetical protein